MSRFLSVFWTLVLTGSLLALAAGFAGGRSFGNAGVAALRPPPARAPVADAVARDFERDLHGVHSLDEAEDPRDAYDEAEDAVAVRPRGWAPATFDPHRQRARVALVVVDAGLAGTAADAFVTSPIPFTLVVPADTDEDALHAARAAGKSVLVDAAGAAEDAVRARIRAGAVGIVSDATGDRAGADVRAAGTQAIVLDPLLDDDAASYRLARAANVRAYTRDVIADGRDADPLVDALFRAGLERAQRTGVAVILLHARPHSLAAAERFALQAQRDDIDLVPIDQLAAASNAF